MIQASEDRAWLFLGALCAQVCLTSSLSTLCRLPKYGLDSLRGKIGSQASWWEWGGVDLL